MKASYFGSMGYSERHKFPAEWPVPPSFLDTATSVQSYQDGLRECESAEELGFDWISVSEHHYSGNRTTPNPVVMAAAVAERCKKAKIALMGQLLPLMNPIRAAEEIGMLDNMTNGRVIMGFMRSTITEDQAYGINPDEGRDRLMEGMDLVLKALTEPQPFSWEGRYYQYRTVSVWPPPVQKPLPPAIISTRNEDTVRYAATNRLGLGIAYDDVDDAAKVIETYKKWCQESGWQPTPDDIVYRGAIYLAETNQDANKRMDELKAGGFQRGLGLTPSISRAVQEARNNGESRPHVVGDGGRNAARDSRGLMTFMGSPDTVVKHLKDLHDIAGVGVVDFGFQQPGVSHKEVMKELELFGREVLPQIKEF
jgi:alkanesulfonate monooxygenase SsuD/methylene tetrahydromethanopterin reductase-like flavin-dependent oxidoreductase (luciferase family)